MHDENNGAINEQRGIPVSKLAEMINENELKEQERLDQELVQESDPHDCVCDSEPQQNKKCAMVLVTKTELFTVFFILLMALCVFTLTLQRSIVDNNDALATQISNLTSQVNNLKMQVSSLEAKIDAYETANSKPIDITINLDDIGIKYDPETGDVTIQNPGQPGEPDFDPDFDTRPFLGVGFYEGNDGSGNPIGIQVNYVYQYSPAEKAGIRAGDIIMAINGVKINTYEDLSAIMDTLSADDTIEVQIATTAESGVNVVTVATKLTYRGNYVLDEQE